MHIHVVEKLVLTERVQVNFRALLIRGYPQLTQRHHFRILSPACILRIPKMESVWANNCRSVFASSTPTSKVTCVRLCGGSPRPRARARTI